MANLKQNAKEVFYKWLEEQPSGQTVFLDQACGENHELRQKVEALIRSHQEGEWILEKPLVEYPLTEKKEYLSNSPYLSESTLISDHVGTKHSNLLPKIPGYETLRILGRGGMGVVYLARQIKANRLVALKILLSENHSSASERKRFQTECEAIARLQHPGIVQIFEVNEHNGCPFFSLEYCEGGSLAHYLRGTPIGVNDAARLVISISLAIHVAHQAQVIHRDLKPGNILLAPTSVSKTQSPAVEPLDAERPSINLFAAKVTDFGLAKQLDESTQTKTGLVMGTPSYMAPEQAKGKKDVGIAADIYALGAILYDCLTGRPPFKGATSFETVLQVTNEEPVSPRQLQPNIPRDLETICLKCLSKAPEKRYASALELADDLSRFTKGEPIQARRTGAAERAWRWCRRNPIVAGLLVTIFVVLLAGIIGTTSALVLANHNLAEANSQKVIADKQRDAAKNEKREAEHQKDIAYKQKLKADGLKLLADKEAQNAREAESRAKDNEKKERFQRERAERAVHVQKLELARAGWFDNRLKYARDKLDSCDDQYRNWEYYYLHDLFYNRGHKQFHGHAKAISRVLFSPDGKYLVSQVQGRGPVRVWDINKAKVAHSLKNSENPGRLLFCQHPETKEAVLVQVGLQVRFWNPQTGEELQLVPNQQEPVIPMMAYNFREEKLYTSVMPSSKRGMPANIFRNQPLDDWLIRFSPDRSYIVAWTGSRSDYRAITLWDGTTFKKLKTVRDKAFEVRNPTFCGGDGKVAWLELSKGIIRVCDTKTGKQLSSIKDDTGKIRGMAFSPDGQRVAAFTDQGITKSWDVNSQKVLATYRGHKDSITCIDFSPDGRYIATGGRDKTVILWDTRLQDEAALLPSKGVETLCFQPKTQRILVTKGSPQMELWNADKALRIGNVMGKTRVDCACFGPDGKELITGEIDTRVHVRDAITGREKYALDIGGDKVYRVAYSGKGKYIAASTYELSEVRVWDVNSRHPVLNLNQTLSRPYDLAFSPDEKLLAVVGESGTFRVWNIETKKLVIDIKQNGSINSVCFSPDGTQIATGDSQRKVTLWDTKTGTKTITFFGHNQSVQGVSFSPDGTRLASCSSDGFVKLWDPVNLEERELFSLQAMNQGKHCRLTQIQFGPDGRFLAAVAPGKGVIVWDSGRRTTD